MSAFLLGWCGTVPLSVLIWILLNRGPKPPPPPWEILLINILGGIAAMGVMGSEFGRAPGLGGFGEFIFPIAIGVNVAGLYLTGRMMMGLGRA